VRFRYDLLRGKSFTSYEPAKPAGYVFPIYSDPWETKPYFQYSEIRKKDGVTVPKQI
jgi:hypothetical protein